MNKAEVVAPGVEVVTVPDDWSGVHVTMINGGKLDGEKITGAPDADPHKQHVEVRNMAIAAANEEIRRDEMLARMRTWSSGTGMGRRRIFKRAC